jgi:hypothetical protein
MALEVYPIRLKANEVVRLAYMVEHVSETGGVEIVAASSKVSAAWGALRVLIPHRSSGRLVLRQGARVIGGYPEEG